MEKFQKYCLSVLLVIICSNISAQISNGSLENENCQKLREFYSKFLDSQDCGTINFATDRCKRNYNAIHHRQYAGDVIENTFREKQAGKLYNTRLTGSEIERHTEILENFEKNTKGSGFAETVYLESKVSKIRNKDYLGLLS